MRREGGWALVKIGTLKCGQPHPDGSWDTIPCAPQVVGIFDSQQEAHDAGDRYAAEDGSTEPVRWMNFNQGSYADWLNDLVDLTITTVAWGEPGAPKRDED